MRSMEWLNLYVLGSVMLAVAARVIGVLVKVRGLGSWAERECRRCNPAAVRVNIRKWYQILFAGGIGRVLARLP